MSPRTLRKASRHSAAPSLVKIAGEREPTETGYRVLGYAGKSFETFYEVMLSGTASAFLLHEKKDKSLWIISGQGFITTETKKEGQKTRRLIPGDAISLDRGTTYRIATTATGQLEFFVSQSAKYAATLTIVAPADATRTATASELEEPSLEERLGSGTPASSSRRNRRSKAALQQSLRPSTPGRSLQVEETFKVVPAGTSGSADGPITVSGLNAQPSGGRFNDEGAG